ncbi:hypothetical protein M7I_5188 [Glarea lozoyensis 74030]|uniref:Syntaxin-5 N-terminal Sly1p-binding domain-containing protein n=1 Tax=Glarea lozoyensis (strain ATCC 74030 / MF5533) TaxID=1104152 RepID=H0ER71_GLAL7|nr:hypothetical protein M7I_5188 [Glarea lozoyensis 74030]
MVQDRTSEYQACLGTRRAITTLIRPLKRVPSTAGLTTMIMFLNFMIGKGLLLNM